MAKVDILLPYWGDFKLLKKAVESVLSQTEQDWRLLVFDDCYESTEPADYFSKINDKRVNYYRHKKNLGITKNFNFALSKAKADYFVMFGCDDIMLPDYIESAISKIGICDFYQPGVQVIDAHDSVYNPLADRVKSMLRPKKAGIYKGEKLATSLSRGNWLYFPSILWKTGSVHKFGFDEKFKVLEDVILEMNIILDGGSMYLDDKKTFQYRRFKESVSSKEKSGVRFQEEKEAYAMLSQRFHSYGWRKASIAAKLRLTSRLHQLMN